MTSSDSNEHQEEQIQHRLEAFEGEGPPSDDELLGVVFHNIRGALANLDELASTDIDEYQEDAVEWTRDDLLEAKVALEMERGRR